jgi:hypothetical protein
MKTIDIQQLSKEEKLGLMEAIWEDLSKSDLAAPTWHEEALKQTEMRVAEGQEIPIDWQEAKKELRSRYS